MKTINITLGFFGRVETLQVKVTEEQWKHQARLKNRFEVTPLCTRWKKVSIASRNSKHS